MAEVNKKRSLVDDRPLTREELKIIRAGGSLWTNTEAQKRPLSKDTKEKRLTI